MNLRQLQMFKVSLQLLDLLLVWASFYVAIELRVLWLEFLNQYFTNWVGAGLLHKTTDLSLSNGWASYSLIIVGVPLILSCLGFYRDILRPNFIKVIGNIIKAALIAFAFGIILEFFFKLSASSRLIMVNGIVLSILMLSIRYVLVSIYVKQKLKSRYKDNTVLLIQDEGEPSDIIKNYLLGEIVLMTTQESLKIDKFEEQLKSNPIEKVIINSRQVALNQFEPLVDLCSAIGIEIWWHTSALHQFKSNMSIDYLGEEPLLVLHSSPRWQGRKVIKGIFDRSAALVLLIISLPFCLFAILGIALTSPGPVFFRQERSGLYGQVFSMWKFRTMSVNAPELLDQLKQEQGNDMDGPAFKLSHDPRIFPFGRILRKTSIDELPQLINVLMGDMSLVGPRPLPTYEVAAFTEPRHRRRLSVKPGITCIWQVEGRSNVVEFEDWIKLDLHYIDNWSLRLDLLILLKTIPAVLLSKGAK